MKFTYTARDGTGQLEKGVIDAPQAKQAAAILAQRRLFPIAVKEVKAWMDLSGSLRLWRRPAVAEVTNFTRQLATMVTAGLPLTDGLNLLKLQASAAFAPVVGQILEDVQAGVSLSGALAKHSQQFSAVYVALVKAGEAAGVLETILSRLADSLEKSRAFASKVKGAMIYPAMVLVGMLGVMLIMVWVVIPRLTVLYDEFGVQLPLATRILVGLSRLLTGYGVVILPLVVLAGYGVRWYVSRLPGRKQWDELVYKLPVIGPLLSTVMLAELTRTLSLLVGAGVSIVDALKIVAGALGNSVVEEEVRKISDKVEKGFPLSIGFSEGAVFPPLLGQMTAVGEETGKIDDVLAKLSTYYETESEEKVKALTTAIEPLIIIVLGLGVGFLIFSIVTPIYNLTSQF